MSMPSRATATRVGAAAVVRVPSVAGAAVRDGRAGSVEGPVVVGEGVGAEGLDVLDVVAGATRPAATGSPVGSPRGTTRKATSAPPARVAAATAVTLAQRGRLMQCLRSVQAVSGPRWPARSDDDASARARTHRPPGHRARRGRRPARPTNPRSPGHRY